MALQDFISGFCGCALWLGHHYESEEAAQEGTSTNLDEMFDVSDIPADVMKKIADLRAEAGT